MAYLEVTIDSTLIDSNLTNFPVGIKLDSSHVILSGLGATDYEGFHFTVSSVECYAEIDVWDMVNEIAIIWVKVPNVSSSSDTVIVIENVGDDNTSYVGVVGSTPGQSVWDNGYDGVYHMSQDPSASSLLDSTSNGNDAVFSGSMTSGDLVDGNFGKAIDFDGSDDVALFGDVFDFLSSDYTVEIYSKQLATTGGTAKVFFSKGNRLSSYEGWAFFIQSATIYNRINASNSIAQRADRYFSVTETNYNYYVMVIDRTTSNELIAYLNGETTGVGTNFGFDISSFGSIDTANQTVLGAVQDGGARYLFSDSQICEVRISSDVRSAAWIKATYNILNDSLLTIEYFSGDVPISGDIYGKISISGKQVDIIGVNLLDKGEWRTVKEIYILNDYAWRQNIKS